MQGGEWATSARALVDRSHALAREHNSPPTTLHLTAALMESQGAIARLFRARGVRAQDHRTATRVHPEEDGVYARAQARALAMARAQATEATVTHLVVAAVLESGSALGAWLSQLECEPTILAQEIVRAAEAPAGASVSASPALARAPGVQRASGQGSVAPVLVSTPPASRLSPMDVRALGGRVARQGSHGPVPAPRPSPPTRPGTRTAGHRAA